MAGLMKRVAQQVLQQRQTPESLVEPPVPMPDPEGASFQAARRRATVEQRRRRGRASTIFTAFDGDTLG